VARSEQAVGGGTRPTATRAPLTWREMHDRTVRMLVDRTGEGVEEWNRRIAELDPPDEASLRAWLNERGVTGYPQGLLVMERFGYPDFLLASADELIDGQYRDRPALRPVLEAILAAVQTLGPVSVQARKTYVSLVSPRRTFAVVKASTRQRVDLGLRIDGLSPGGRLEDGSRMANATINLRIGLFSPEDLDDEALGALRRAYLASA
jgi:Domain of unknown function (DUF5655)